MAVPAHDTRDFEFAVKFNLPIITVVDPGNISPLPMGEGQGVRADGQGVRANAPSPRDDLLAGRVAFIADGTAINSGPYNGLSTPEFKTKIAEDLAEKGIGRSAVNYKLRDWLFSRQHFWGEPFPILHELDADEIPTGRIRPLKPEELPLDLPAKMSFDAKHDEPTPPLDKASDDWLYVTIGGKRYKRETNTMPQWAGSCWYYLRFLDPKNNKALVDPKLEKAWMPVDLYVGGAEHAVLHLLYARFWHKVLYDRGYVSAPEPFQKLVNQGMILGEMEFTGYQTNSGQWISATEVTDDAEGNPIVKNSGQSVNTVKVAAEQVEKQGETFILKEDNKIRIDSRAYKMSKSRGNVVNPDQVVAEYGADALRLYEMFMGPLEAVKPWSMDGVSGVRNFLDRVWRLIIDDRSEAMQLNPAVQDAAPSAEQNRMLHKTIKAVTNDIEQMSFNTAIARMMEFTNFFFKEEVRPREAMQKFVLLLSPYAPHLAEELWQALSNAKTLAYEPWPAHDEAMLKQDTIEVPVQVNGKLRGRITVPTDATEDVYKQQAINSLNIKQQIKVVVVRKGKIVNIVLGKDSE